MSDWQKIENTVENPTDVESSDAFTGNAPEGSLPKASPRRTRKRRSDAGKKRVLEVEPADNSPVDAPENASTPDEVNDNDGSPIHNGEEAPSAVSKQPASDTAESHETPAAASPSGGSRGWTSSEPVGIPPSTMRYTATGRRKGQHRFAAPLGLFVLLLAAVGMVSLVIFGIDAIRRSQDDTALREELTDFLMPVIQFNPSAFTDINETKQDSLLQAAIWRVTDQERIRQLRENTIVSKYELDDMSRMLIPLSKIEESYAYLYGPDAKPDHHTIGDEGKSFTTEYDGAMGFYHVPIISSSSMYVSVMDTLKQKGDTVTVRIGYVLSTKIGRDEKGELVKPSTADAEFFQKFTVKRVGEKDWMLVSITDEKPSVASTTAPATGTSSSADTTAASNSDTETTVAAS